MHIHQQVGRDLTTCPYSKSQVTRPTAIWNYVGSSLYRQVVKIDLLQVEVTKK